MNKEGILRKLWVYLLFCLLFFTITAVAQTNDPLKGTAKITGAITNDGPIKEGEEITFIGSCTGEETKLILCKNNVICNDETSEADILCASEGGNAEVKTCTYLTTLKDSSQHSDDIATCCDAVGCDENTLSVNTWSVLEKIVEQRLNVVDEEEATLPVTIKEEGTLVDVLFTGKFIDSIKFTNPEGETFGFSEKLRGVIEPDGVTFSKTYSLDLDSLTFTEATLSATASATALYQCKFWDFELSVCLGSWDFVKSIKINEPYSFNLIAGTFGFAEGEKAIGVEEPLIEPIVEELPKEELVVEEPVIEPVETPPVEEPTIKESDKVEITGTVTNRGNVVVNSVITFTGSCTGKNTQLVVCKENSICNSETLQEDLLCTSAFTDESEKECAFTPSSFDEGIHTEDIATCCSIVEGCDSLTTTVDSWAVTSTSTSLEEDVIESEQLTQEPAEINKPVNPDGMKVIKLKNNPSTITTVKSFAIVPLFDSISVLTSVIFAA